MGLRLFHALTDLCQYPFDMIERARVACEERADCERGNQDSPRGWSSENEYQGCRARDSTAFRLLPPSEERARLPTALRRSRVGKQKI
jgi:hypothetical protein